MNSAAAMAFRIDTPMRSTRCELRTATTAPRSRSTIFSAGSSCSMLLLASLLALVRVAVHELPIRELDPEHKAPGRHPWSAAALRTRRLRFPVLGGEHPRRGVNITLARHQLLLCVR